MIATLRLRSYGAQRAKITEKVHKPPQNYYWHRLKLWVQGEKGRTFILFLWDGTHWANFNKKVHKPQIKSYGSLCVNMQSFLCVSASQLFGLLGTFYITKYCIQNCIIKFCWISFESSFKPDTNNRIERLQRIWNSELFQSCIIGVRTLNV